MSVDIHLCTHASAKPSGAVCIAASATGVQFRTPQPLAEAAFPVNEVTFPIENTHTNPAIPELSRCLEDVAAQFAAEKARNTIVYSYGQQGAQRRPLMFGKGGYAEAVLSEAARLGAQRGVKMAMTAYIMGTGENLVDGLNPANTQGIVADTVKEGPRIRHIDRLPITGPADVAAAAATLSGVISKHFATVQRDAFDSPEEQAMPPYNSDTVVLAFYRFNTDGALQSGVENNSIQFICLGDSERPVLCGIDPQQMQVFEKHQKTLGSVAGVIQAIRNNRLRIPYGKSKLTLLLKRAYNGEKNNENNATNQPTKSVLFGHVTTDDAHAEEAFHTLTMLRRVGNAMGATALGSATRDMAVDKWRLEQDIMELKDELTIARQVHDYKPCIFEQPKPVANIAEEEHKRIQAILKKRDDAREKQLSEIKAKAIEEANRIIAEEERKNACTLESLEKEVEARRAENAALQTERATKVKEYEKQLEKLRKKKDEEESLLGKLKDEISALEEELTTRKDAVDKKKRQLEAVTQDQERGREAILKEREEVRKQRGQLLDERRQQREQWIAQIRATNEKVLAQVQLLTRERKNRQQKEGLATQADEEALEETEEQVREDIQSIDRYLPKLISLEDTPADQDTTEAIRKQLEEYFLQERDTYLKRLEEEKERRARLEKTVESFRAKLQESQAKVLKDQVGEALRKEQHLQSLVDQVLQYLCNGVRMVKVNSQGQLRRRFFFLSETYKSIHACELDDIGMPIGRRRPPVNIMLRDIKQVVLGAYTPSFVSFGGEANLSRARAEAIHNEGTYNPEPTQAITPQNLGRHTYRSFAFIFRGGKTLELVCDSDSDCEAWILALKRLLNFKTEFEIENEKRARRKEGQQYVPTECTAPITWGAPFDLNGRDGLKQLRPEEAAFCSNQHVPPQLFLRMKQEMSEKAQTSIITVYDIRVTYTLDLLRSQAVHEYFVSRNIIPQARNF